MNETQKQKAVTLYEMLIEKKGNPTIQNFMDIGYTEARATEMFVRIAGRPDISAETLVEKARIALASLA